MNYKNILFDWGNTLMVDFKDIPGPMCDWEKVEAIPNAAKTLEQLSKTTKCYVATNAGDSSGDKVMKALNRVGLGEFITKVFSSSDIGAEKPSAEFFNFILAELNCRPDEVVMIGDHLDKDVRAAQAVGINAIWFNPNKLPIPQGIKSIHSLLELIKYLL